MIECAYSVPDGPPSKRGPLSTAADFRKLTPIVIETPSLQGRLSTIETVLPATRAHDLQRRLPGLTRGEGVFESSFAGYQPVTSRPAAGRRRTRSTWAST